LTWTWPEDCSIVRIVRRADIPPEGAEDAAALWWSCSRSEFVDAGERLVDTIRAGAGPYYYAVYAQAPGSPATFAPGANPAGRDAVIDLAPVRERRWSRFFCKAVAVDPAQRHMTLFVHPNTCAPITDAGEIEKVAAVVPSRRYDGTVPRAVVCPSCFEEFPS